MENKKLFESVLIFKGELTEKEYKRALKNLIKRIKEKIEITKIDEVGKKQLAYEIQNNKTGYYIVIYFNAENQAIIEIERIFRITDEVIKFITIKRED